MRRGVVVTVSPTDYARLTAIVANPNTPQKHVWRADIVRATAEGLGTAAIMRRTGKNKSTVWRWQARYQEAGVDGLLRDRTRPPGTPPTPEAQVQAVLQKTLTPPPDGTTHWTARRLAAEVGLSHVTVWTIWRRHGLMPHRCRQFKLSTDPAFASRTRDVIGVYVNPPDHAVVFAVDEKTQIQALSPTQAPLPMKKGRPATRTHDYRRGGTTTLFAALDIQTGRVTGQCHDHHRHQEFLAFLDHLAADVPADQEVHVILDNYATHKQAKVQAWLAAHPRWTFHFTPTSCSWRNAVEGFFAKLSRRLLQRGLFASRDDLERAILAFLDTHNAHEARAFQWRADPEVIIAAHKRGHLRLEEA